MGLVRGGVPTELARAAKAFGWRRAIDGLPIRRFLFCDGYLAGVQVFD
jgi:hypothetical protein